MVFPNDACSLPTTHVSPVKLLQEACAVAYGEHMANRQLDIKCSEPRDDAAEFINIGSPGVPKSNPA